MEARIKPYLLCSLFLINSTISCTVIGATISISTDNDGLFGTDKEYSSGLFLRWSQSKRHHGYSAEIGSQLWTPSDIEQPTPQPNERPYAGLSFLKLRYHNQDDLYAHKYTLMLGRVGPDYGAENSQKIIHDLIGSPEPMGWAYQISNDTAYQLGLESHMLFNRHRFASALGEWSGFARGQLGNFQPDVALGITYRYGVNLLSTFGATSNLKTDNIDVGMLKSNQGFFIYFSSEASYRFYDMTIEGNKPAENYPIHAEDLHWATSTGVTWYQKNWGVSLSMTIESRDFKEAKRKQHSYANLTYFYRWF